MKKKAYTLIELLVFITILSLMVFFLGLAADSFNRRTLKNEAKQKDTNSPALKGSNFLLIATNILSTNIVTSQTNK